MNQNDKFHSAAEYNRALERVSELVQSRLVDCGWKDQVRLACRKILENDDANSVNELIEKVTPKARSLVPDSVKRELLHELEVVEGRNSTVRRPR